MLVFGFSNSFLQTKNKGFTHEKHTKLKHNNKYYFCDKLNIYTGISFASASYHFYLLFLLYGLYAAATEGISKAWITNISDKKDSATAIGFYSSFQSIAALLASSLCGLLWFYGGSGIAFLITSIAAVVTAIYLGIYTLQSKRE